MSASYDEEANDDLNWARAQLGDTDVGDDEENALLTNERIAYVLALFPLNRVLALGQLAHELLADLGQQPDTVKLATGLSVSFKNMLDTWKALAAPYRTWLAAQATASSTGSAVRPAWSGDVCTEVVW